MNNTEKTTDRQERISGFDQITIHNTRVCVIGAGATGNEVLKNLSLVGFGYIFVTDMDHISTSNLSRTVLFTEQDINKRKAVLAAERAQAMNIDGGVADYFDGDICHDLGEGVFRHSDIIIGCVDNEQTRLYVSNICQLLKKPYIDTGIGGFNWNVFTSSGRKDCACYACTLGPNGEEKAFDRIRNSCDVTRRKAAAEKKIPTIVIPASVVGGQAAFEAIKIAHDLRCPGNSLYAPSFGIMTHYSAVNTDTKKYAYKIRRGCTHHDCYDDIGEVIETPMSARWKLKDALEWAREQYGTEYEIALYKDCACADRGYVTTANCEHCGAEINVYRPQPLEDIDLLCEKCRAAGSYPSQLSNAKLKCSFSLTDEKSLLEKPLKDLGIPLFHIVEFSPVDGEGKTLFLELTGDLAEVMPHLPRQDD